MSDEEAVRKGRKAQQILEDETLVAALTKLENDQLWIFKSTRSDETAKREQCWAMLKGLVGCVGMMVSTPQAAS